MFLMNYLASNSGDGSPAWHTDKGHGPTTSEVDGADPTVAEHDGPDPTLSDNDGDEVQQHETSQDTRHLLSSSEAVNRFNKAGLPRSQRSIERYCNDGKLDCIKDPDEGRHYITPESVDRLIRYLREIQMRHQASLSSETVNRDSKHGMQSGVDETRSEAQGVGDTTLRARTERLQREMDFKDMYIEKLEEEREKDKERLVRLAQEVGELSSEVRLLSAPTQEEITRSDRMNPRDSDPEQNNERENPSDGSNRDGVDQSRHD